MRTSWEAIAGGNAVDTLSAANVYALPQLARGEVPADQLIKSWLHADHGLTGQMADDACDLMLQSWQIPAAAYWDDQVFPRHSCLPSTWQEGWMSMETIGMGRRDRALNIPPQDERLSEAARKRLFAEKESATAYARQWAAQALALRADLPRTLRNSLPPSTGCPLCPTVRACDQGNILRRPRAAR